MSTLISYSRYYSTKEMKTALITLGYKFTNFRRIAIEHLGYATTKELLMRLPNSFSNRVLYYPLVYRDNIGLNTLINRVEKVIEANQQLSSYVLDGWFHHFRYENVFRVQITLLVYRELGIKSYGFEYETSDYLP